jgi:hypothetical protein
VIYYNQGKRKTPKTKKEVDFMTNYEYIFADGYYCYTVGKMTRLELSHEVVKHGKVISMKIA